MVLAGIEGNYAQLRTVRVRVRTVYENPKIREEKTIVVKRPQGGFLKSSQSPRREVVKTCVMRGQDLHLEIQRNGSTEIRNRYRDVWSHYSPAENRGWIGRPDQQVGVPPEDPRDVGILFGTKTLAEVLRQDTILSAEQTMSAGGGSVVRVGTKDSLGRKALFEFDGSRAFLPSSITYFHEDATANVVTAITYQEVLRKVWFLKRAQTKAFADGTTPEDQRLNQVVTTEVQDAVVVNEPVTEDVFVTEFPKDAVVSDTLRGKLVQPRTFEAKPAQGPPSHRGVSVAVGAAGLALVVLVVWWAFHSRRESRRV